MPSSVTAFGGRSFHRKARFARLTIVNAKKVRRLMREHDLNPRRRRRFVRTTDSDHDDPIHRFVAKDFEVHGPDQLWGEPSRRHAFETDGERSDLRRHRRRLRLCSADHGRLDIHRVFAEAVVLEDGTYRRLGRIGMTRDHLEAFAATLHPTDHVVVEGEAGRRGVLWTARPPNGNATAVLEILAAKVERVAVANPFQVHLIARAKTKTDKIDARVLARLYAAGFLPEVWIPDEMTLACSATLLVKVRDIAGGDFGGSGSRA